MIQYLIVSNRGIFRRNDSTVQGFSTRATRWLSQLKTPCWRWDVSFKNHTVWRGAYNASIDLSSYMSCRNKFWRVSRATLEPFLAKILGPWANSSMFKKGRISKMFFFWPKRTVFRFFLVSSVTIIAMKYLKKAFESSWNALSLSWHHISTKFNSLGYRVQVTGVIKVEKTHF